MAECDKMKYCVFCGAAWQSRKNLEVHVTVEHDPGHVLLLSLYNVFFLYYIVFIDETINIIVLMRAEIMFF